MTGSSHSRRRKPMCSSVAHAAASRQWGGTHSQGRQTPTLGTRPGVRDRGEDGVSMIVVAGPRPLQLSNTRSPGRLG